MTKQEMYKTAIAKVSCQYFKAGEAVAVKFIHSYYNDGKKIYEDYYKVSSEKGFTYYPEDHLEHFVL